MPTLAELRDKWFIDPSATDPTLPPTARHPTSTVQPYTDGNLVEFLVDGKDYMRVWHDSVLDLTNRGGGEILHSGWRFEGVKTLGESVPASDALEMLQAASLAGVSVYVMMSVHGLGLASALNDATCLWLVAHDVPHAVMDGRFPPNGSSHQKVVVFKHPSKSSAVLGSVDISKSRWDTSAHLKNDSERHWYHGKATHDTGVRITGPAVADVEAAFRVRWNDSSRNRVQPEPGPLITSTPVAPMSAGTHSVQLLQTYGRTELIFGRYSWAATGEFTYWASWLNAVKTAKDFIYIEDQYFLPGGTPPFAFSDIDGFARNTEPIYQLGQALKKDNGPNVLVMLPSNAEDSVHEYIKYQRDLGIAYLHECAAGNGRLQVVSLEEGRSPIYVHSKLLLVDDEFMIVGSGNVGQRSFACDGELSVGVVDSADKLVRQVRTTLWAEHLRMTPAEITDVDAGLARFRANQGRVRPYPYATPSTKGRPTQHDWVIRTTVDPYYGPLR
uniref:Phospholipase D family protein n=1 Tax=Streptomyces sp. NBC_00093 TaxID=2975649 RepID=A0AAU2AFK9_9ACTN